jgi:hypothetical protein
MGKEIPSTNTANWPFGAVCKLTGKNKLKKYMDGQATSSSGKVLVACSKQ